MKRKKFLALAASTAMLATMLMPSAFATTGSSSTTVTVTEDTTFTLSITGSAVSAVGFNGISAEVANDTDSVTPTTTTGEIKVVHYSPITDSGHHLTAKLNDGNWVANSTNSSHPSATSVVFYPTADNNTTNDKMRLSVVGMGNGSYTHTPMNADACSSDTTNMSMTSQTLTESEATIAAYNGICPGTFDYVVRSFDLVAPQNGLGQFTYTIAGTITAYRGQ